MSRRNLVAAVLIAASFIVLIPGLILPLITITASADPFNTGNGIELFRETRSIVQTVKSLHESGNNFVAFLILLFSILIPFAKGTLLLVALAVRGVTRSAIHRFVNAISKWSMADVFVVGVFVAFLAAKATDNLDAIAERGFYYFAVYCLLSIASAQVMDIKKGDGDSSAA